MFYHTKSCNSVNISAISTFKAQVIGSKYQRKNQLIKAIVCGYTCEMLNNSTIWTKTLGILALTASSRLIMLASQSSIQNKISTKIILCVFQYSFIPGCIKVLLSQDPHKSLAPMNIESNFQSSCMLILGFDFNIFNK